MLLTKDRQHSMGPLLNTQCLQYDVLLFHAKIKWFNITSMPEVMWSELKSDQELYNLARRPLIQLMGWLGIIQSG